MYDGTRQRGSITGNDLDKLYLALKAEIDKVDKKASEKLNALITFAVINFVEIAILLWFVYALGRQQ